ncbi:MAG: apolipoprotein N-acyltransferase [Bdellovibrionaceae bacterium]|nr:apolipoprotein N-acyltransferase [Pseudobdellovibrionaceae bacterium]
MPQIIVRLGLFFKNYRWSILSGFMMGTSYIPLPPWALAFCWVPLWLDLRHETSLKKVFWKAWVAQFILSLIGFHWIAYVAHEFGYLPWPIAILALLGFASFVHLYIPFACLLAKWIDSKWPLRAGALFVLFAVFQNAGETLWPSLFPWNLGYPLLWAEFPIFQFADVVGFLGLSLGLHLANAFIAGMIRRRPHHLWVGGVGGLVLLFVALNFWGQQHGAPWKTGADKTLRVLQVQANIGNLEKVMAEKGAGFQADIKDRYFRLTRQGLAQNGNVDLIVWPESAYPDFLGAHNAHRYYNSELVKFVQEIQIPILTGSYANDLPGAANRREYNGMFLYQPDGTPLSPGYHKTYLLAFGEYVPFGEMFPYLKKINPGGPGFGRGSGPTLFQYGELKIGPQICYESLYPDFTEALVRKGAEVLVNLTNDSWFGPGFEPRQHMIMTLARGVEARRPLVRSTNTGITTAILADGTQLQRSPTFEEWASVFEIPYRTTTHQTFYIRYGAYFPVVLLLIALIAGLAGRRKEPKF